MAPSLHDAAARWRKPDATPAVAAHDALAAGNVIALKRSHRESAMFAPPVAVGGRPSVAAIEAHRLPRWLILLAVSAMAHFGLYLPFRNAPTPMASIGEVSVSVEIVLGADQHAGLVPDQGTSQASAPAPAQAPEVTEAEITPEPAPAETARVVTPTEDPVTPPEQAETARPAAPAEVAAAEVRQETAATVVAKAEPEAVAAIKPVAPIEPAAEASPSPAPIQAVPQAQAATASELHVSASPMPAEKTAAALPSASDETPVETSEAAVVEAARPIEVTSVVLPTQADMPPARPEQRQARPTPDRERPRETARERRPQRQVRAVVRGERNRSQTTSPAAAAAGGVGRGRSDASSNYRGLVAAHLARHKRFPDDARSRGSQGSATVTFALDGGGRVTAARLARGSGIASLDQEAVAMVRRASPFPPPPGGRGTSFTVPVSFRLN